MARPSKMSALTFSDLQGELRRRERTVGTLARRHARLLAKIRSVEGEIAKLGGSVHTGVVDGRKRPRNEMNLVEALAKVLDGKTMSVTAVSQAVQKAGYKTTSPNFRTIVNQTLINSGKFKRVDRGMYTAK